MPSKRKQKLRDDALFKLGWFPIHKSLWRDPGQIAKKLRVIADANFPDALVEYMRKRKIEVQTARSLGLQKLSDENLRDEVAKRGCVLITLDRDFWSDERFPLHLPGGVIYVAGQDEFIGESIGFELLLVFLVSFGGGWSYGKLRSSSESLYWKLISFRHTKVVYEIKAIRPGIYAREVEGFD